MLPSDIRDLKTGGIGQFTADGRFPDYVRRLFDLQQMDFEAAFDQLMSILSWEPQKVYAAVDNMCLARCYVHCLFLFCVDRYRYTSFYYRKRKCLVCIIPVCTYFESEIRDVDGYRNEKSVGPR